MPTPPDDRLAPARPSASERLTLRFLVVYVGLFCLATQVAGGLFLLPGAALPALGVLWPLRPTTIWLATNVFGVRSPLVFTGNSGDTAFFWVETCLILVLSALAAAVWSALDRRSDDRKLRQWSLLFLRFALAGQMFDYGMAKVIPTQFPAPSLLTLVEPVGNLSLTGLLWTSIGASTGYQMFTGWAEIVAGVLLVVPRTATLGALICLADMVQVLALNLTYDIGLKIIAAHLTFMTLLLLVPDGPRLLRAVFGDPAPPPVRPHRAGPDRSRRAALIAQVGIGVYLLLMYTSINWTRWTSEGGGRPAVPLYGIWNVEEMAMDGQTRSPILNDYDRRWRRLIFDTPGTLIIQRTDDSFAHFGAVVDASHGTLDLAKGPSRRWKAPFTFERPSPDQLIVDGEMDEHRIHARLALVDLDTFRLLNSGFRWVRPPD